jgi:hypothetical protein
VDTGFAIGSMLRLQVPRVRMADVSLRALAELAAELSQRPAAPHERNMFGDL